MTTTTTSLPLAPGTWTTDAAHTTIGFAVRHLGVSKVHGRFRQATATVDVGDDLAATSVTAEVDMASVDTDNPDRDGHLKSADFFDAEQFPTMTFRSTDISGAGDAYTMTGDLTVRGVTRPVELEVEFFGTEVFPMDGTTRAGFEATGTISRKDFGMEFNMALGGDRYLVADKVRIQLDVQLVGPADS
jgi:polyisoprenoid-binding protein YceI